MVRSLLMVLQIIQHSGPLPVSEDNGAAKPVLSRKAEWQLPDLTAVPPRSRNSTRPQHQEAGNVEGILTLQLSHPNVVQTYKAATRPLQVSPPPVPFNTLRQPTSTPPFMYPEQLLLLIIFRRQPVLHLARLQLDSLWCMKPD